MTSASTPASPANSLPAAPREDAGQPPNPSADRIVLTGLRAYGRHGVFDFERADGQDFVIDVTLELDLAPAAKTDEVADTVHYGELADRLVAIVAGPPVALIETLADRLVHACLDDVRVAAATVTVHKPHAPIAHSFTDVAITMRRTRAGIATGYDEAGR